MVAVAEAAQGTRTHEKRYRSYLLRCWQERTPAVTQQGPWRYSLEEPGTGHRRGFASLAALVAYLEGDETDEDFPGGISRDSSRTEGKR